MSEPNDIVYQYDPTTTDDRMFKEGVTEGWLYLHNGKPGPARALKMTALADDEGVVTFEPNGEWQDVTVVDIT